MDGDVLSVERVIPAAPDKIFDLVADAFRRLETGHLRGKVVIVSGEAARPES